MGANVMVPVLRAVALLTNPCKKPLPHEGKNRTRSSYLRGRVTLKATGHMASAYDGLTRYDTPLTMGAYSKARPR